MAKLKSLIQDFINIDENIATTKIDSYIQDNEKQIKKRKNTIDYYVRNAKNNYQI